MRYERFSVKIMVTSLWFLVICIISSLAWCIESGWIISPEHIHENVVTDQIKFISWVSFWLSAILSSIGVFFGVWIDK